MGEVGGTVMWEGRVRQDRWGVWCACTLASLSLLCYIHTSGIILFSSTREGIAYTPNLLNPMNKEYLWNDVCVCVSSACVCLVCVCV